MGAGAHMRDGRAYSLYTVYRMNKCVDCELASQTETWTWTSWFVVSSVKHYTTEAYILVF